MQEQGFQRAKRRYHRLFWPLMGLYLVCVLGGTSMLVWLEATMGSVPALAGSLIAVLCTLPLLGVFFAILRYIEETDEYTRLRQLRAFALAAAITVSAIFLFGFLQIFHVLETVEVFWFGPFFLVAWGLLFCRMHFSQGAN